jgi:hypothetical protein
MALVGNTSLSSLIINGISGKINTKPLINPTTGTLDIGALAATVKLS